LPESSPELYLAAGIAQNPGIALESGGLGGGLAGGEEVVYDLYPPIVEESFEADGRLALIINDGMHRLYLARLEWVVPQVTYVRGIPKEYPYYAFPRPGGWEGLDLLADNPDPQRYLKKCHRTRHNKKLYRDFQAVFQNVGRSRSRLLKK
jgi:hypothetical protein